MIFWLTISINVAFLFAIWRVSLERKALARRITQLTIQDLRFMPELSDLKHNAKALSGKLDKMYIRSVIAEKMAERAFNMASASNLGVIALQKALVIPRIMTRAQTKQNQLAKNSVDKLFTDSGGFDYLKPILSDEDLELIESIQEEERIKSMNSSDIS